MRQVSKITGDGYNLFLREFELLGSPRTILSEYLGISKSYLNKWLLTKSVPESQFADIILFFVIYRLTNELPTKKLKRKNDFFEVRIGGFVKKMQILLRPNEKVNVEADIVIVAYDKRIDIRFLEAKSTLEQQELYKHIFDTLVAKEGFDIEIERTEENSYRFITDDNDIESLIIKINKSTSYKLFLKKIINPS